VAPGINMHGAVCVCVKKKKKFIWLNTITMNMTIFNIKQSQVARKPWGHPSWPPKHKQAVAKLLLAHYACQIGFWFPLGNYSFHGVEEVAITPPQSRPKVKSDGKRIKGEFFSRSLNSVNQKSWLHRWKTEQWSDRRKQWKIDRVNEKCRKKVKRLCRLRQKICGTHALVWVRLNVV